jgi:hypothetical protein
MAPDKTSETLTVTKRELQKKEKRLIPQHFLNLADQERQIGFCERKSRRGDAVVLDVGRDVLVVWVTWH